MLRKLTLIFALGVVLLASSWPGQAQEGKMVTLNFRDVEISVLTKLISDITKKNFVLDERVRGSVTIISPTPVTEEEAYQLFLAVLDVKGFAAIPAGKVIKIVPASLAKQKLSEAQVGEEKIDNQNFVTQILPIKYADASTVATILMPLVPPTGSILAYAPSNLLIISDIAANVDRLSKIVKELDSESLEKKFEVIKLKYAMAEEVATAVNSLLSGERRIVRRAVPPPVPGRPPVARAAEAEEAIVSADPRSNSLLVTGTVGQIAEIKELVAKLDTEMAGERMAINVHYLVNAVAEDVAKVLNQVISGRAAVPAAAPAAPAAPEAPRRPPAAAPPRAAQPEVVARELVGAARLEGAISVVADKATNSLVITAVPSDYEKLKQVIAKLDIRRRQVYVEAMIMELGMDRARELGLELQGVLNLTKGDVIGRTNLGALGALTAAGGLTGLAGLVAAAFSGATITLPDGTVIPARQALFRAFQTDSQVNLLSTPHLLTMDNEEAEILVGSNVPLPTGRLADQATTATVLTQVQRQDIGVILRLTPQITEGDFVRLNIYQEISGTLPCPAGIEREQGLCLSKRTAKSVVVVKDGQMVVIGGLIEDNTTARVTKVPLLGDIPILGNLFKVTTKSREKSNLVIFLVPQIVRSEVELERIRKEREEKLRDTSQAPPATKKEEKPSLKSEGD